MTARLHWTADAGFTLELDREIEGVTVRFLAMPIPADGTAALTAAPVPLYAMDLLFKSHVDLGDAPGQLHDAKVQLIDGAIALTADLEDAETGQTRPFSATIPVTMEGRPPESGGPVPAEPDEDDLAWDDEDEDAVAMLASTRPGSGAGPSAERGGGGLDALLAALTRPEAPGHPPVADPDLPPEEDVADEDDDSALDAALLAALLGGGGPSSADADRESIAQARDFLGILLAREEIELADGASLDDLAPGAAPILSREMPAEAKAAALSDWLLDQDAVEELYVADEDLEALLEQW